MKYHNYINVEQSSNENSVDELEQISPLKDNASLEK